MEARVPRGRARGEQRARAEAARAGLATSGICGKAAAITNASLPQEGITLSLTANMLANQIQISIESASDRYDLASRLNSVLDAASSLDETERTIIAATVSTAQHSFEYWGEVLPYSQPDIWSQYTDCAAALKSSGYSSDQGREVCLEGGAALISLPYQRSAFEFRTAAWSVPRVCGLRGNFKAVAGADAAGAFAGGVKVAIFGPPGIVTGALAGATAASSGQWAKSTWDLFWCAMK
jgi:hypothetical protein